MAAGPAGFAIFIVAFVFHCPVHPEANAQQYEVNISTIIDVVTVLIAVIGIHVVVDVVLNLGSNVVIERYTRENIRHGAGSTVAEPFVDPLLVVPVLVHLLLEVDSSVYTATQEEVAAFHIHIAYFQGKRCTYVIGAALPCIAIVLLYVAYVLYIYACIQAYVLAQVEVEGKAEVHEISEPHDAHGIYLRYTVACCLVINDTIVVDSSCRKDCSVERTGKVEMGYCLVFIQVLRIDSRSGLGILRERSGTNKARCQ